MRRKRCYILFGILVVITYIVYRMSLYYTPPTFRQPYQMVVQADDTIRIAYIGDSWAYLHGVKEHKCRIARLLQDTLHCPVRVSTFGISGLTSKELYEAMYDDNNFRGFMSGQRYDYCYISAGINDTYRKMSIRYFRQSMNCIIQMLLYNDIHPIIQEIPDYDITISYYWQNRVMKLHRHLSMLINSTPLDCKQMFRDALDEMIRENGYLGNVSILRYKSWNDNYLNDISHLYLEDRLHLNENGYSKLDSAIVEEIISSVANDNRRNGENLY